MESYKDNPILLTDSYKPSQWKAYPPGSEYVYSYFESRGGKFDSTVFWGLQFLEDEYLSRGITPGDIWEAEKIFHEHYGRDDVFNIKGWKHILEHHAGFLPLKYKAVPEGSVIPNSNILMSVENTCPHCAWVTNYVETLLVQLWYPCTVATLSLEIRKLILKYLNETGDPSLIDYKLHDFGFRGVSSVESAAIGGAAHLLSFNGSDTLPAIKFIQRYYAHMGVPSNSIPATEHSNMTSWGGPDGELDAMRNWLDQYPTGMIACVSDSYDIMRACNQYWGSELRDRVLGRDGVLVVRPDSGDPPQMVVNVLNALGDSFGYSKNSKGFKVLPPKVRVIQGDGVNYDSIGQVLYMMTLHGWSTDNITFGMGGALLQRVDRDLQKYALKCSEITVNGVSRDVFKDPVSDPGKRSKAGRLILRFNWGPPEFRYETVRENAHNLDQDILEQTMSDSVMYYRRWPEVRKRVRDSISYMA